MNRLALFEQYPMTASSPEFLAKVYGNGASIAEFSASLPQNANVIDVGAGLSTFGAEVASRRGDIRWTNFDYNFSREHVSRPLLQRALEHAPDNVRYMAGSIFAVPEELHGQFDRAFSYNLVPHILRADRELGHIALRNMVGLLNENGQLMVGAKSSTIKDPERRKICTLGSNATEEDIEMTAHSLTTSRLTNVYHDAVFASGVAVYPARRFDPEMPGKAVLSDDGGQTYHKVLSPEGLKLTGRFMGGLFHVIRHNRPGATEAV